MFSIRGQLLVITVVLLSMLAAISYSAANIYGHRAAQLSYDRILAGAALQISESISLQDGLVVVDLPTAAFETLSLAPNDRVFYAIKHLGGELITGYDDLPSPSLVTSIDNEVGLKGKLETHFFTQNYQGESVRFITFSQALNDVGITKFVQGVIGQTMQAREEMVADISWRALQFMGVFFVLAVLFVSLGIWLLLRQINRLNRALSLRSPVDLSPIDVTVPQEIQPFLQTINHFMAQLSGTLGRFKRFTGEAAHQIRTPLAGLKSQAQNALEENDPQRLHDQLQRILECSDTVTDTVNQMLNQAQLAHRFQSEMFISIRLDLLVKDVCRDLAVSALQNGVELAYLGDVEVKIHGDKFALKQMLENIIENATKYSSQGDVVEVELSKQGYSDGVVISIRDEGPGIPIAERQNVFDPFYRSPNNPRSGSGLGLTIAKEIAEHHDAILELKANEPKGLLVEIMFEQGVFL